MIVSRRSAKAATAGLIVAAVALTGCQQGPQKTYDLGSTEEACYPQRAALADSGNYFAPALAATAFAGAMTGAFTGSITLAIIGGLAGGAIAATAAAQDDYWNTVREKETSGTVPLLGKVRDDIRAENTHVADFKTKVRALVDCRQGQVNQANADYAAKRLGEPAWRARIAELKALYDEDLALARNINGNIDARGNQLLYANAQINPDSELASQAAKPAPAAGTQQSSSASSAKPAQPLALKTAEEKDAASEVQTATLTNVEVRREVNAEIEQAASFGGFSAGLKTTFLGRTRVEA